MKYKALFDLARHNDAGERVWECKAGEQFDAEASGVADITRLVADRAVEILPEEETPRPKKEKNE